MPTIALSEAALALFRRHVEQKGKIPLDDSTREPYRELAAAGLMCLSRPFVGERVYRLTEEGFGRKAELLADTKATA